MGSMKDLLGDAPYPQYPGYTDKTTSLVAAASVAPSSAAAREAILASLRNAGPATADELAERMGWSVLYARPRTSELAKLAEIVPLFDNYGRLVTRKNSSGRSAKVWRVA